METGRYVAEGKSPYELQIHLGYPPLWGFWCDASYLLSHLLLPGNTFAYILIIKAPIIAADFLIAWALVAFRVPGTRQIGSNSALSRELITRRSLATLFLLNPYVLIVGPIWGMMDNIAALLIILVALALFKRRDALAGVWLGLAVALKLYPVLFLVPLIPYFARTRQMSSRSIRFFSTFALTELVSVVAPFLVLGWNVNDFFGVLTAQTSRKPGGISPIGLLPLLINLDIQDLGPISLHRLSELPALRLVWIPAVCLAVLFVTIAGVWSSFKDITRGLTLVYMTYLLTAPWVSEQNVEILLVFMLFEAIGEGFEYSRIQSYGMISGIVAAFAFFNVPATSFIFPVYVVDAGPLQTIGKYVVPSFVFIFTYCIGLEMLRTARRVKQNHPSRRMAIIESV
jgi:hypothetical protein